MWKTISSCRNYQVSKKGEIRNRKTKKVLKQFKTKKGYFKITLTKKEGGCLNVLVHRMVAIAFLSNPLCKPQVNHIDGKKENNNVKNLEWATQNENIKHAHLLGLYPKGQRKYSKLTYSQVLDIRSMFKMGERQVDIKKKYDVSMSSIHKIVHFKTW